MRVTPFVIVVTQNDVLCCRYIVIRLNLSPEGDIKVNGVGRSYTELLTVRYFFYDNTQISLPYIYFFNNDECMVVLPGIFFCLWIH